MCSRVAANSRAFDLLAGPYDRSIPVTVSRDGKVFDVYLAYPRAGSDIIVDRVVIAGIAFVCWGCGYLLAIAYRTTNRGSTRAGMFWMAAGAVLGLFLLAMADNVPLFTILLLVWSLGLMPLLIILHLTYPQAVSTPRVRHLLVRSILTFVALCTIGAAALIVYVNYDTLTLHSAALGAFALGSLLALIVVCGLWQHRIVALARSTFVAKCDSLRLRCLSCSVFVSSSGVLRPLTAALSRWMDCGLTRFGP